MKLNSEKMPKAVKEFIDNAQKNLTQLEGKAREKLEGTYQKVAESNVFKNVECKVTELKKAAVEMEKKVQQFSTEMAHKAFNTIGVATKADIKTITAKVDSLKKEIRKFIPGRKTAESRSSAN